MVWILQQKPHIKCPSALAGARVVFTLPRRCYSKGWAISHLGKNKSLGCSGFVGSWDEWVWGSPGHIFVVSIPHPGSQWINKSFIFMKGPILTFTNSTGKQGGGLPNIFIYRLLLSETLLAASWSMARHGRCLQTPNLSEITKSPVANNSSSSCAMPSCKTGKICTARMSC